MPLSVGKIYTLVVLCIINFVIFYDISCDNYDINILILSWCQLVS